MTRLAIELCVQTDQREACRFVALRHSPVITPAVRRVATLAIGVELPAMNIRVAIEALPARLTELLVGVAINAANVRVSADQRKLRLRIVIEPQTIPQRRPTSGRVTALAVHRHPAVGIVDREGRRRQHEQPKPGQ